MLGTFVEKLGGLFDRRFLVAYWSPLFIGCGLLAGLLVMVAGPSVAMEWWKNLSGVEQVVLSAGSLLILTFLAYMLEAFTTPLIRFYEGYWSWEWLRNPAIQWQKKRHAKWKASPKYGYFPRNLARLRPTRLGNVLTSAEEYPYQLYRQDAVIWWPSLVTLLPEALCTQLDTALTPMVALLNLSMLLTLLTLGGGVILLLAHWHWWLVALIFVGGLVLAHMCYRAAVNQALDYGRLVRVAFDFYRHEILKQMHIPVPDNLVEERHLWDALTIWVRDFVPPWEGNAAAHIPQLVRRPFYYDMHPPN